MALLNLDSISIAAMASIMLTKWEQSSTFVPLSRIYFKVGTASRMRVSSSTSLVLFKGTFKSALTCRNACYMLEESVSSTVHNNCALRELGIDTLQGSCKPYQDYFAGKFLFGELI